MAQILPEVELELWAELMIPRCLVQPSPLLQTKYKRESFILLAVTCSVVRKRVHTYSPQFHLLPLSLLELQPPGQMVPSHSQYSQMLEPV